MSGPSCCFVVSSTGYYAAGSCAQLPHVAADRVPWLIKALRPAACPPLSFLPPVLPQALEYQLQQGIADTAKIDACLVPAGARHDYAPEAHCAVGVIRRLQEL